MNKDCTIYQATNFIGKKWTLLILHELYKGKEGARRYTELKNSLPDITPKVLSTRLKELNDEGLVKKKIDTSTVPVKCEYSLSNSGMEFIEIIKQIKNWTLKWKIKNKVCEGRDCKDCDLLSI